MPSTLKLLSYNVQVAIPTRKKFHYLLRSWHHVLPHWSKLENLMGIAQAISPFDVVALQELDAGSFRSHNIDQLEYLANHAHFDYWHKQTTRNLGRLAQHSKGILSRQAIIKQETFRLPARIPGRGIQAVTIQLNQQPITIFNVHLSLSRRCQLNQIACLVELSQSHPHAIIMGDFNVALSEIWDNSALKDSSLQLASGDLATFPSWQAKKPLDAILVSNSLTVTDCSVLPLQHSDHLPITATIELTG